MATVKQEVEERMGMYKGRGRVTGGHAAPDRIPESQTLAVTSEPGIYGVTHGISTAE